MPTEDKDRKKEAFRKNIPIELHNEIEQIVDETKRDNRERSLTFCKLPGREKVHVSNYAKGTIASTEVNPCAEKYGRSDRVGDMHTHPVDDVTIGITPSEADFVVNMDFAHENASKQVSCISNHESKMIHCFQAKRVPDRKKVSEYQRALLRQDLTRQETEPFFRSNIGNDFVHAWFDRSSFKRVGKPAAKELVKDALGKSVKGLRLHTKDMEKGTFCDLIQDYNNPEDDRIGQECRKELKKRKFLIFEY